MASSFPWVPVGTEVSEGIAIGRVINDGNGYQIVAAYSKDKVILTIRGDASWVTLSGTVQSQIGPLVRDGVLMEHKFGEVSFWVGVFAQDDAPVKVGDIPKLTNFASSTQLLNLASALAEMEESYKGAVWSEAIYLPSHHLCLVVELNSDEEDKKALCISLLTGGVTEPMLSPAQIRALNPWITISEIEEFFSILDLRWERAASFQKPMTKPEEFTLPGRPKLEAFFREYVIDIYHRRADYEAMGISVPKGILLKGPPGCGKTYAVQKLSEFLALPVFDVDVATVGSPYIHQTSKILGDVFSIAAENAPSIVLMEEIDALAGDRDESRSSHKVEEVSQLLRLIEKAADRGILVIGTSTRLYAMDDAIVRKGRFDHVLEVGLPNVDEISAALDGLLKERPTAGGLNIANVASKLKGRPMSEVAWVVNEAARIAVKTGKKVIDDFSLVLAVKNLESR